MTFRQSLVTALNANAGISALVSGRVFPGVVPEGAILPAIAWQVISIPRNRPRALGGQNLIPSARVQISVLSKLLSDCESTSEAVRQCLDAFTGPLGNTGPMVVETILENEQDFHDDLGDATGLAQFRTVLDFLIRYREAAPARLSS